MNQKKTKTHLREKEKQLTIAKVIRFLAIRARSKKEVTNYLTRKTKDSDLTQEILSLLEEIDLINDQKFTDWFISSRLNHKPKGPHIISLELKKFGIDPDLASTALNQIKIKTWQEAALKILQKKHHSLSKLSPQKLKTKARQLLYTRGFNSQTIKNAIDEFTSRE